VRADRSSELASGNRDAQRERSFFLALDRAEIHYIDVLYLQYVYRKKRENREPAMPRFLGARGWFDFRRPIPHARSLAQKCELHRFNAAEWGVRTGRKLEEYLLATYY
jgi:hypothetical protein